MVRLTPIKGGKHFQLLLASLRLTTTCSDTDHKMGVKIYVRKSLEHRVTPLPLACLPSGSRSPVPDVVVFFSISHSSVLVILFPVRSRRQFGLAYYR